MQTLICNRCQRALLIFALLSLGAYEANVIRKIIKDKPETDPKDHKVMSNDSKGKDVPVDIAPPDHMDGVRIMRGGQLNKDFQQEVFLGPEHADFETIPEKEGKRRLMEIFSMADTSKDELLDLDELTAWISLQTEKHFQEALESSKKIFPLIDADGDGIIHWDEYREQFLKQRGYDKKILEDLKNGKSALKPHDEEDYLIYRDRWTRADEDEDDILKEEEFLAFLHPEHCKTMLNLLVDELLHDFDANGDSKLSLSEFVSMPMMDSEELEKAAEEDEWVKERLKEFRENMDLNHDNICDKEELEAYLDPRNRQHAEGEARHLIGSADDNEDGKLSPREVLRNYFVFIGSKLYNYGRNVHDEF
ncbi:45 kDa calcium-binding protein-like [Asterias rubens]|uniref:45 kDa calcium-binding protein-like n=1 Tax=Asterias rubens TaxID=7604 RepID=UPI0014554377|nr:45 kDa calcium-binding protein-like [Asterias rubens]